MQTRTIPSTGEALPVIGLGTWQTFDVEPLHYPSLEDVLRLMHHAGGQLIDSSPMYGRAEEAVGNITGPMSSQNVFFYATKVWTKGADAGKAQIRNSYRLMKREVMDLVQIHNLLDWKTHLPHLRKLKEEGILRYIGITHYQDSSHADLAEVIRQESIDFIQFNYSINARHAEKALLPLCVDMGVATLINRPFGEGALFRKVAHKPLPPWATEVGIASWSAYFLQFILAHPGVTCVIPATGNPAHAADNLGSGEGVALDKETLQRMVQFIEKG
ncbi:MAG TPA: aldo/keto reductase [Flavisolibacter sp.]|jgi:diketogulonate reductase-like aldo/keto reductase|nr:aldo/keto reductase [Flavisolibacter sp.]